MGGYAYVSLFVFRSSSIRYNFSTSKTLYNSGNTYYALGLVNLAAHLFTFSYHRVVPSNFKDRFQYKICNDDCGCIALVAKNNFGHSRHQYQPDGALMLCSRRVNTFTSRRGFYQWLVVQLAGGQLAPL